KHPELVDNRCEVSLHDIFYLVKVLPVFGFGLFSLTGPLAVAEMVFQAYPELPFADVFFGKVELAGPQGDHALDKIEQFPHLAYRGKGAEVFGAVVELPAGEE